MDAKLIGSRLKAARESLGFTQEHVAKFLGIKREVISYIETGARPISTVTLSKIADLYGYRASHFVQEAPLAPEPQVSMAFRVSDLSDCDISIIAQVNKIAMNLDKLSAMLEDNHCV
ncbi:Helix-turn-helix domain-containing protein [Dehalogenimonas formicexedens]|uniref:Helix-turn-helix domain-containing protein n=1 Tax=Dehalogenimonas formicexedens TaxID=1839801 RepID=A0A1P8F5X2_9CHLR|nr:helix-turn-helix transcriptional regulator [Dehalogenimonas formicexedens]APV43873.1 Helix-turn-helix domain-containing protein [Dehalogenimonas formicexedens]